MNTVGYFLGAMVVIEKNEDKPPKESAFFFANTGEEIKQIVRDNINKLMPLEILNLVCIISCSKRLAMLKLVLNLALTTAR